MGFGKWIGEKIGLSREATLGEKRYMLETIMDQMTYYEMLSPRDHFVHPEKISASIRRVAPAYAKYVQQKILKTLYKNVPKQERPALEQLVRLISQFSEYINGGNLRKAYDSSKEIYKEADRLLKEVYQA